jgi:hypothetical protein
METQLRPPIFLIGNYRSGTTITQKLIGLHPDVVTWYEPRTLWLYADPARRHDEFGEADATDDVVRYIRRRFLKYQTRHGGRQVMENTPSNVLRVPYVNALFPEAIYLFMTRNPFSCISSMDLKWRRPKTLAGLRRTISVTPPSQLHYYAGDFIRHVILKRVFKKKIVGIYGPRYNGIDRDLDNDSRLKVVARQWARCNGKAREDLSRLGTGRVLSFRYEDLIRDPGPMVRRIYDHCGLNCTDDIALAATQMVDPGRQEKWRRLDPDELRAVVPELLEEMAFYSYEVPAPLL